MEHHSNIVPWQLLAERTGATLRWFDVTDQGRLDLEAAGAIALINERTKIVSVAYVSNVLGTVNPIAQVAALAHAVGAELVVDASQAVPQIPVDVSTLGADLIAFTGHKMVGPTGIGVLWGRYDLLASLPPLPGGRGDDRGREDVRLDVRAAAAPVRAGTPPIAQAVGLGAAAQYLSAIGLPTVAAHDREITAYALEGLAHRTGATRPGPTETVDRGGAVSFTLPDLHPPRRKPTAGLAGIAVRGGHHCARPLHERSASSPRPGPRSRLHRQRRRSTRWSTGWATCRLFAERPVKVEDLYQEIILALPAQAPQWSAGAVRGRGASVNPSCGDEVRLQVHLDGGRSPTCRTRASGARSRRPPPRYTAGDRPRWSTAPGNCTKSSWP